MAKIWKPLNDQVVVFPPEKKTVTETGLHLPPQAVDAQKPQSGIVGAVGPGRYTESGEFIKTTVKPGEQVLFGAYAGVDHEFNGQKCVLLREQDVLMHEVEESDAANIPVGNGAEVG